MTLSELRQAVGVNEGVPVRIGPGCELEIVDQPGSMASGRIRLVRMTNPFGRTGGNLNGLLAEDPIEGAKAMDALVDEILGEIDAAIEQGADGIAYFLHGAEPALCSPMQYGGFYLERDREILERACERGMTLLAVHGGPGTYIEIVSDLPATIMAWDASATGIDADEVASIRGGLLCPGTESADIVWTAERLSGKAAVRGEAIA